MIYLVSPGWHADPAVLNQRFRAACQATAEMIRQGMRGALAGGLWPGPGPDGLPEVVVLQIEGWGASQLPGGSRMTRNQIQQPLGVLEEGGQRMPGAVLQLQ
jgi:hypothetical protein